MTALRPYFKCVVLGIACGVASVLLRGGDFSDVTANAPRMFMWVVIGVVVGIGLGTLLNAARGR